MRTSLIIAAFAAVCGASLDTMGAGGVYTSLPSRDAGACARLCADDGLCVAWSFQASGACELRATVPAATPIATAHGFSTRAPGSLRGINAPAQPQPIAEPAEVEAPAAPEAAPAPAFAQQDAAFDSDLQLLGGLDTDDVGLRN